ncbi:uncharacterized protein PHALS_14820 [Plasmopara halstedii]|uniref:Uncharacterized protein n=1 Tax=Plasmopara halstedii TaxID=4781 RepID=A0A0P1AX02_PLAHL|nr:uncharacterized protein PHALS_14820 [Plasmopara halstedii]CEG45561.1 hypothetical protein PHALS_14820 [Plasmopara halstedii]|eukprot:XP_024581930.1 hypothetical protein PHALS_14820 [Plasmopara halstedii]
MKDTVLPLTIFHSSLTTHSRYDGLPFLLRIIVKSAVVILKLFRSSYSTILCENYYSRRRWDTSCKCRLQQCTRDKIEFEGSNDK